MGTITRADLITKLSSTLKNPLYKTPDFLEAILEIMIVSLKNKETVKITAFGSFNVYQKAKRVGRNPKTGKKAIIIPRHVISFRPSQYLRKKVQGHK